MQHFSENYWKKRLAKTVFLEEKGKWPENGRNGEKGKRNRMPGEGKRQSPRSEVGAQNYIEKKRPALRLDWAIPRLGDLGDPLRKHAVLHRGKDASAQSKLN